jgi:hypothetical protein
MSQCRSVSELILRADSSEVPTLLHPIASRQQQSSRAAAITTAAIPRCPVMPPANNSKAPTLSSAHRRRTKQSGIVL